MNKPSCVFLDRDSIDCNDLDFSGLEAATALKICSHCTPDEISEKAGDAEIIVVNKVVLGASAFAALPNLKLVCVIATGTNNIDLAAASQHGVTVCNVSNYGAASVSQHVFMLVLALTTKFIDYQNDIKAGAWQAQSQFCLLTHSMQELNGKTLGLIGYGHIAQAVERIALAFGMQVVIAKSARSQANADADNGRIELEELLKCSDVISLHCPLSDETRNLIDTEQLQLMKNDAIIINTARGGIINEAALLVALEQGEIGGAGIDCLVTEPPKPDDPMITSTLKNLIITPHNAWGTLQARQRLLDGTINNISEFEQGRTPNRVN